MEVLNLTLPGDFISPMKVTFLWKNKAVPELIFITPPGGKTTAAGYQIQYEAFDKHVELIENRMKALLPNSKIYDESRLVEAMNYSALSHGKRIRPFLTIISAGLFKVDIEEALDVAVAIEFIVCSTIVSSSAAPEPPGLLPPPTVANDPVP